MKLISQTSKQDNNHNQLGLSKCVRYSAPNCGDTKVTFCISPPFFIISFLSFFSFYFVSVWNNKIIYQWSKLSKVLPHVISCYNVSIDKKDRNIEVPSLYLLFVGTETVRIKLSQFNCNCNCLLEMSLAIIQI